MIAVLIAALVGGALAGWVLTGAALRYGLARGILDRPNERSSHVVPTPLGGGWGVVIPAIGALALACSVGWLDPAPALGLAGGGVLVALIGWIDDRVGLSASVRLLVHVAAASWLVGWLGGYDALDVGVARVTIGTSGNVLSVLAIVWCTNLYNFMDGIDGIAGLEAVCVGSVGGALLLMGGANGLGLIALVTAAASGGFLVWNRPPARIFMGDVGSGFLGFLFAGLALAGDQAKAVPALVWVLLLGVFASDATVALLRRMIRRERWYSAHRTHLYQRLIQAGWTHGQVDRALVNLNLVLALLGAAAWRWRGYLPSALLVGGIIMVVTYVSAERRLSHSSSPGQSS